MTQKENGEHSRSLQCSQMNGDIKRKLSLFLFVTYAIHADGEDDNVARTLPFRQRRMKSLEKLLKTEIDCSKISLKLSKSFSVGV